MLLYLVQHAEAKSEKEDPQRPLTDKGKEEVTRVANYLKVCKVKIDKIFHSGKLRAKQTAEIFAEHLGVSQIEEKEGLSPLDEPSKAKDLIEKSKENLMIVGHLPHLSCLTSTLIAKDASFEIVKFTMGGVLCLIKTDDEWKINWMITPEVAKI